MEEETIDPKFERMQLIASIKAFYDLEFRKLKYLKLVLKGNNVYGSFRGRSCTYHIPVTGDMKLKVSNQSASLTSDHFVMNFESYARMKLNNVRSEDWTQLMAGTHITHVNPKVCQVCRYGNAESHAHFEEVFNDSTYEHIYNESLKFYQDFRLNTLNKSLERKMRASSSKRKKTAAFGTLRLNLQKAMRAGLSPEEINKTVEEEYVSFLHSS